MNPTGERSTVAERKAKTERGSVTGEKGEEWRSIAVSDRFLALKEGVIPHVLASPFEVYEILMGINREQTQGRMQIRVGTSWGGRALLDVKRNGQHYRKHSGGNEQEPGLTGNEKRWMI